MDKLKHKNIYLAAIVAMLLGIVANYLAGKGILIIYELSKKLDIELSYYAYELIAEILFGILVFAIVKAYKQTFVLKPKAFSIKKILLNFWTAGFFIFVATMGMINSINVGMAEGYEVQSAPNIIFHTLYFMTVGIVEEMLFRGIIADGLIRKLINTNYGIAKAVVISGMLFGAMHIINIFAVDLSNPNAIEGVLTQVIMVAFMGMLIAAIYYRTGSFWTVAIVHGIIDIGADSLNGWFVVETNVADSIANYDFSQIAGVIYYVIALLFLLREKKISDIYNNFSYEQLSYGYAHNNSINIDDN